MKNAKKWLFLILMIVLFSAVSGAFAESARVITPGGALNMRKKADEKSKLVDSVPNRSLVEVVETEGEWSKITYKKQTGYVKTAFLKLPSQLPGLTVYTDGGIPLLRKEPSADSMILTPISCLWPVEVLAVQEDWVQVRTNGMEGWTETGHFSFQYTEPTGEREWMAESARVETACAVVASLEKGAPTLFDLEPGQEGIVTVIEKDHCLLITEQGCGYAPINALSLTGPEDSGERRGTIAPMDAFSAAEAALKKKFKAFAKEKLYCAIEPEDSTRESISAYRCGFFNDADQYLYGALVDAETGKVLLLADYTGFSPRKSAASLLPKGEMTVSLSADTLAVGEVLDITVTAWTEYESKYTLTRGGVAMAESEPGAHFRAAYRPREAGEYMLTVTVKDEAGLEKSASCAFTVDSSLEAEEGLEEIYSQKDGWWKDKQYRHSNLGKSGCAIFTLTHALERMGHTEEAILPENLAVKYAYCLIPNEGTSNELLINTAARDFGFQTKKQLYNDKKQIAQLIKDGAYFSFSIARGHIALVSGISEDGTMVRVVDSAPLATFERIVNAAQYYQTRSGAFRAALSLDDMPGARWYFETNEYGGMEYYLPMDYVAKRGVRLIQPIAD